MVQGGKGFGVLWEACCSVKFEGCLIVLLFFFEVSHRAILYSYSKMDLRQPFIHGLTGSLLLQSLLFLEKLLQQTLFPIGTNRNLLFQLSLIDLHTIDLLIQATLLLCRFETLHYMLIEQDRIRCMGVRVQSDTVIPPMESVKQRPAPFFHSFSHSHMEVDQLAALLYHSFPQFHKLNGILLILVRQQTRPKLEKTPLPHPQDILKKKECEIDPSMQIHTPFFLIRQAPLRGVHTVSNPNPLGVIEGSEDELFWLVLVQVMIAGQQDATADQATHPQKIFKRFQVWTSGQSEDLAHGCQGWSHLFLSLCLFAGDYLRRPLQVLWRGMNIPRLTFPRVFRRGSSLLGLSCPYPSERR